MRYIIAIVISVLPFAAFGDAARLVNSDWHQIESPHFRIITNGEPGKVRELAGELEKFRAVSLEMLGLPGDEQPLTIIAAADGGSYSGLLGERMAANTAGVFRTSVDGNYAVINMDGRRYYQVHPAREFLFHEYTHFLTYGGSALHYPYWYSEGFAEFMSTLNFTGDGRFELGIIPASRAATLDATRPMPLEKLLRMTRKEEGRNEVARLYASGWMLTHWLTMNSGRSRALQRYLDAYNRGRDPVRALEKALDLPLAEIETQYRRQFRQEFPIKSGDIPRGPGTLSSRVTRLPRARALAEIARFIAATGDSWELQALVDYTREKNEGNSELVAVRAEAAVRSKNYAEAGRLLASIPEWERQALWFRSADAWLELARASSAPEGVSREQLGKIREQFDYLVKNNAAKARHWYGLAVVSRALGYPGEKYTEMLEQAYLRAPRATVIALRLAEELYRRGDASYFVEVVGPLLMQLEDVGQIERLQRMLSELQSNGS